MSDPVTAALIGAGGSLLGGIFGKSRPKYVVPNYAKIRQKAEEAGFNPLTALGLAPGSVVMGQNSMGSALADAALLLADGYQKNADEKSALAKAQKENEDLRKQLTHQTLRPPVGGIYAQRHNVPTLRQALGAKDENADDAHPLDDQLGDIPTPDPKLDRASPGYVYGLNWEATPGFSPGQVWEDRYGDTPLNWPIAAAQMAADVGYNAHKGVNYAKGFALGDGPVMRVEGKEFALENPKRKKKIEDWAKRPSWDVSGSSFFGHH